MMVWFKAQANFCRRPKLPPKIFLASEVKKQVKVKKVENSKAEFHFGH